jgi:hypothetical protein
MFVDKDFYYVVISGFIPSLIQSQRDCPFCAINDKLTIGCEKAQTLTNINSLHHYLLYATDQTFTGN